MRVGRARLVPLTATGALVALVALGCTRANPAFIALDGGGPGQGGSGGSGGGQDSGADTNNRACSTVADCMAQLGAPTCTGGSWQCLSGACAMSCPGCTDNDKDGYGVGVTCTGPDCNDNDPNVGPQQSCYSGDPTTLGAGKACRAGVQFCPGSGAANSTCAGEVLPSGEACNGEDDDCDGTVDNGKLGAITCGIGACAKTVDACTAGVAGVCTPAAPAANATDGCPADNIDQDCDGAPDDDCTTSCIFVSPSGNDSGDGTWALPYATVAAALNAATSGRNLCLAGTSCSSAFEYDLGDAGLEMKDSVSVYGNYDASSTTPARCPLTSLNVSLRLRQAVGVHFSSAISHPTFLDGVAMTRLSGGSGTGARVGITVDGSKQVTISNVQITDVPNSPITYGIDLKSGAEATIVRSVITGGGGTAEATGIHAVGAKPIIRDNCAAFSATGGCSTSACDQTVGIRGRNATDSVGVSTAILLDSSPGAVVDRNVLCAAQAPDSAGVRIRGPSETAQTPPAPPLGVAIRGNSIVASAATQSHGVWMDACGGGKPRIANNELIQADGAGSAATIAAVGAAGDCHPVIDGNLKIVGGGDTTGIKAVGVFCGAAANVASRCTIFGNKIQGSSGTHPASATAIQCQQGGCMRIARNVVVGNGGVDVIGISIASSGPLVERNDITGGCGTGLTYGVLADDTYARLENNVIRGAVCSSSTSPTTVSGVLANVSSSQNEVDMHSNTIDAGGTGACVGAAATLGVRAGTSQPTGGGLRGVLRNNILRAGGCTSMRYGLLDTDTGASLRLIESNDFDPTSAPTALYRYRAANNMSLNGINSPASRKNISVDPMFVSATDLHLMAGSACVDAGTTVGAPALDYDGKARNDGRPDIGAFER
jgi:hypothetical protein